MTPIGDNFIGEVAALPFWDGWDCAIDRRRLEVKSNAAGTVRRIENTQ